MLDRRRFLGNVGAAGAMGLGASALAAWNADRDRPAASLDALSQTPGTPDEIARDEDYWARVQQAFIMDRSIVNLNNGGVSPSPSVVHEATLRRLTLPNTQPPPYVLWQLQHPQWEAVRERLAREWGVDKEEIAFTRNSSESLQTCQLGLDLKPGDEVLTTTQDYPRMITTFKQRQRREGIVLKQFKIPVPCDDPAAIVRLYETNITPRTRMILACHMINLTGQVLPVKDIAAMARTKNGGIPVIIDGAHAFAHLHFKLADLGVDYYGASLHKWLTAPIGTGLLYVKRDKVKGLWPLMAAGADQEDNIRKFEETGTRPEALTLGVAEALTFHQVIGGERKMARLVYLRDYWAGRLLKSDRVRLNTSRKPGLAGGLANVHVEGLDTAKLQGWLWTEKKILTVAIMHEECEGLRISPNVYTTLEELDRFCEAVEWAMKNGLPA